MATQIVQQDVGTKRIVLDEEKICQLMAVLAQMWPDVAAKRAPLTLIQGGKGSAVDASAIMEVSP